MIVIFEDLIINIFVKVDDFYKVIIPLIPKHFIEYSNNDINKKKKRIYKNRIDTLSESEIITILILYQLSQDKNLKAFYNDYRMNKTLIQYFPKIPSYGRFVLLEKKVCDFNFFIYPLSLW